MQRFVALDLSLRGIGFCHADSSTETLSCPLRGIERIVELRDAVLECLAEPENGRSPDLVLIEDYAFSAAAAHAHELGELGGAVKVALHEAGQPYVLVAPASLKKFATGKGNANKIAVAVAAAKVGREFGDDNQCDAWWLQQMAIYRYIGAGGSKTAYRDETLSKITWPELVTA